MAGGWEKPWRGRGGREREGEGRGGEGRGANTLAQGREYGVRFEYLFQARASNKELGAPPPPSWGDPTQILGHILGAPWGTP